MRGDHRQRRRLRWPYLLDGEREDEKDEDGVSSSSSSSNASEECNWWVLCGAFLIELLIYGMISSFGVLIAWQVEKKGFTLKLAFWTPAVFTVAWFLSDPLSRKISSGRSARRLATAGVLLIVAGMVSSTTFLSTNLHFLGYGLIAGMGTSLTLTQVEVILRSYCGTSGHVGLRMQCVPQLSAAVAQFVGPLVLFGLLIQFGPSGAPLLHAAIVLHALLGVIALRMPPPPKTPLPVLTRYRPRSYTVVDMDELDTIVQRDRFLAMDVDIPAAVPAVPDTTVEDTLSTATNENKPNIVNLGSIYKARCRNENGVEILPKILEETEEEMNADKVQVSDSVVHLQTIQLGGLTKWNLETLEVSALAEIPATGISKSLEGFLDDVERERKRNITRAQRIKDRNRWSMGTLDEILPYSEWNDPQISLMGSDYLEALSSDDEKDSAEDIENVDDTEEISYKCSMKRWDPISLNRAQRESEKQLNSGQTESKILNVQINKHVAAKEPITVDGNIPKETNADMLNNKGSLSEQAKDVRHSKTPDDLVHVPNTAELCDRQQNIILSEGPYNLKNMASPDAANIVPRLKPPPRDKKQRWSMGSVEEMVKRKLKWDGFVKDDITMSDKYRWYSDNAIGFPNQFSVNKVQELSNKVHESNGALMENSEKKQTFSNHPLDAHNIQPKCITEVHVSGISVAEQESPPTDCTINCGSPLSIRRLLSTSVSSEEEVKTPNSLRQLHKLFAWTSFPKTKFKCLCKGLPQLPFKEYLAEPYFFPSLLLIFTSRFCPIVFFSLTPTIPKRWRLAADEEAAFAVSVSGFVWFCALLLMPWCSKITPSKRKGLYVSGTFCGAVGLHLLSRGTSHSRMTLGCALFGLGQGVTTATGSNVVRDALGPWSISKLETLLHIFSGLLVLLFAGIIGSFLEVAEASGLSQCFSLAVGLEITAGLAWLIKPTLSVILYLYNHKHYPDHHRNSAVIWNGDGNLLISG